MTARPSRNSLPARVGVVLLASVALLAACESALPTAAEMEGMNASTATKRAAQVAHIDTLHTLYLVDGLVATKLEAEAIAARKIASINIIGGKGSKNGATVQIRTLNGLTLQKDTIELNLKLDASSKPRTPFNGLLIVNGVETESSKMNTISPDKIESVEVVKGASATAKYSNPLAANGVIVITLKK